MRTRVTRLLWVSVIVRTLPRTLSLVPSNWPTPVPASPKRASSAPLRSKIAIRSPSPA